MRALSARAKAELLDLRGAGKSHPELYGPDDYGASQAFARERRWPYADPGEDGLIFESVRHPGGTNICLFRPRALALPIMQGDHYEYVWDAAGALSIVKLTLVRR